MGSVNSGEWGDDLPPHPSPGDGHGKPLPDRLGGQAGVEGANGVKGRAGEGSWTAQHGGWKNKGGGMRWREVWPGLRSGKYDWGIR